MKKYLKNIFIITITLVTFGLLLDDDKKEPSTIIRFTEFFAMLFIVFIVLSTVTFIFLNLSKRLKTIAK